MRRRCCGNKKTITHVSKTARFLRILSEENRLKILCFLEKHEKCVCDIWKHLCLPQNLVSHHLKVLKNFELVSSKQEGLKVIYFLNKKNIEKYLHMLNNYFTFYGGKQ